MHTLLGIFPVDQKLYTFESQLNPFYLVLDEGIMYLNALGTPDDNLEQ